MSALPRRIYLDHAATTPLRPEVVEALAGARGTFGNPSSLHQEGRRARELLESSRDRVARALGASGSGGGATWTVHFTSGGTEANHAALAGAVLAARHASGSGVRRLAAPRVVASAVEHLSILEESELLAAMGAALVVVPCRGTGDVDASQLARELEPGATVVSLQVANNEVGVLQPVSSVATLVERTGALFHVDAVQALGKVPFELERWGADLVTLTGHKVGGPRGIGVLLVRAGAALAPLLRGGGQERGLRAGTESVALAAGLACAVELAVAEQPGLAARTERLRDAIEAGILRRWPRALPASPRPGGPRRLPNLLNVSFPWVVGESLVRVLDALGIAASTGSACSSSGGKPSHVLTAMGFSPERIRGSLRLSLGPLNVDGDDEQFLEALAEALGQLESLLPDPPR